MNNPGRPAAISVGYTFESRVMPRIREKCGFLPEAPVRSEDFWKIGRVNITVERLDAKSERNNSNV